MEIYDTAGQSEFHTFRDATLSLADGFIVVYAVDSAKSFSEAQSLITQKLLDIGRPIRLVGNKTVWRQGTYVESRRGS